MISKIIASEAVQYMRIPTELSAGVYGPSCVSLSLALTEEVKYFWINSVGRADAAPSARRNMAAALAYTQVPRFGLDSWRQPVEYCRENRMDCTPMVVGCPILVGVAATMVAG